MRSFAYLSEANMKHLLLIFSLCFAIDASAFQWIQRASLEGVGRHRTTGVGYENRAYVGMGHFNGTGTETYFSDWWCYEPSSNSWSQKADYPGNNGNGNCGCHSWVYNDFIYVGLGENIHRQFYKYDPATNTWTLMANAPSGINFQDTQDMVVGDKAYFTNIWNMDLYEYDCANDTWTLKGPLPISWNFSFAGFTYDNKCWVKADMDMYMYDPAQNLWYQVVSAGTFPGAAKRAHACFFVNDKFYIACGYGQSFGDVTSEVWEFDPATYQWTQMQDFQGTSRRYTLGFSIGNKGYMCTGTNGTNMNDLWEFNPAVNGVDQLSGDITFTAFPNPVIDQITIQSDKMNGFEVQIYDLTGKLITSRSTSNGSATIVYPFETSTSYIYKILVDGKQVKTDQFLAL